jgi:hypothetical protein
MSGISRQTSAEEIAARVSQALESAGIAATLSGGGAVSIYSHNDYASFDLDFITNTRNEAIAKAIAELGFRRVPGAREFEHPESDYRVEFPPGPLAFGETVVRDGDVPVLQTDFGPLRVVTPTQSIMDRLAAYVHWRDRQALDQAIMVARRQRIDWDALEEWARHEAVDANLIDKVRQSSGRG